MSRKRKSAKRRKAALLGWRRRRATAKKLGRSTSRIYKYRHKRPRKYKSSAKKGLSSARVFYTALNEVKDIAKRVIHEQPRAAFGHGWLYAKVYGREELIAYIQGFANHDLIESAVRKHPAVSSTWINMD